MNKLDPPNQATHLPMGNAPRRRYFWRWLIAVLLLAAGIGVLMAGVTPESFSLWIEGLGLERSGIGARIAFFFIGLILVSVILPKTVVSLGAGALFGTVTGGVLIALISVVAAVLNYMIGRWWFRDSILHQVNEAHGETKPTWVVAISGMSAEAGYGPHLLLRFASIPSMLLNYFMGAVGARIAPFMTAAVLGILPQLLWVHGGAIASIDSDQIGAGRWLSTLLSLIAALAVTVIVPGKVMNRIRQIHREKEQEREQPIDQSSYE